MGLDHEQSVAAVSGDEDRGGRVMDEDELWNALFEKLIKDHGTLEAARRTSIFLQHILVLGPEREREKWRQTVSN